ncbi:MAG: hypothetical protein ABW221_14140 [Vicinamibacteria bacterium]
MRTCAWLTAFAIAAAAATPSDAAPRRGRRAGKPLAAATQTSPLGAVTVAYDTGVAFEFPTDVGDQVVGNRFDTRLGGPLAATNRVTRVTLFPQNSGTQSFTFALPPDSMGSAPVIQYFSASLMAMAFNSVELPTEIVLPPSFIVTFIGQFGGAAGLTALDDMSLLGQGFHAIRGTYASPSIVNVASIPNRNALLRVTGPTLPVELIDFQIR